MSGGDARAPLPKLTFEQRSELEADLVRVGLLG
jgi:hypothetical protein